MVIKILGSGCPNCVKLEANAKKAVEELGVESVIEKITDMGLIIGYGVMSTPALVIDEQIMTYGVIPSVAEIKEMITKQGTKPQTQNTKPTCGCSCGCKC
jgi:small redox-active disulfide protein 2